MNTRTLVATIAAAGALTVGSAGAAFAASSSGSTPSGSGTAPGASHSAACGAKQAGRLYLLEQRQSSVQGRITKLQAAEANATGHTKLLARITKRLGVLEPRATAIAARIQKLETRCPGLTPAAPTTGGSSSTPSASATDGSGAAPTV